MYCYLQVKVRGFRKHNFSFPFSFISHCETHGAIAVCYVTGWEKESLIITCPSMSLNTFCFTSTISVRFIAKNFNLVPHTVDLSIYVAVLKNDLLNPSTRLLSISKFKGLLCLCDNIFQDIFVVYFKTFIFNEYKQKFNVFPLRCSSIYEGYPESNLRWTVVNRAAYFTIDFFQHSCV
jgi:hypothetical protein